MKPCLQQQQKKKKRKERRKERKRKEAKEKGGRRRGGAKPEWWHMCVILASGGWRTKNSKVTLDCIRPCFKREVREKEEKNPELPVTLFWALLATSSS